MSDVKEMTVEEKKAAAKAAREQAAAKKAEEKKAAEAESAKNKDAEHAQKVSEALTTAGTHFTSLQGIQGQVGSLIESLNSESTVEQVQTVVDNSAELAKAAKGFVKAIKDLAKKFKDSAELGQAVVSAEQIMTAITEAVTPLKTKVSEAKKAAKEAEKAEAKRLREEAKAANAMPKQNDVTRPRPDTACGKAWELFDNLSAKMGQPVPIAIALQASEKQGLVFDTVKTQYARWKKFNGITGRVAVPVPAGLLD